MVQVLESAALDPRLPLVSTVASAKVLLGGSISPSVKWGNIAICKKKMSKNGFNMTGLFRVNKGLDCRIRRLVFLSHHQLVLCLSFPHCRVSRLGLFFHGVSVGSGGQSPCGAWHFVGAQAQGAIRLRPPVRAHACSGISCCLLPCV